jgi:arginine utilization protein RocB
LPVKPFHYPARHVALPKNKDRDIKAAIEAASKTKAAERTRRLRLTSSQPCLGLSALFGLIDPDDATN